MLRMAFLRGFASASALAVCCFGLTVAPSAQAQERATSPDTTTKPLWGLFGAGVATFLSGYGVGISNGWLVAIEWGACDDGVPASCQDTRTRHSQAVTYATIPVAGPLVGAAGSSGQLAMTAAISGVVQLGGIVMMIAGASMRETVQRKPQAASPRVLVLPTASSTTSGVAAVGTF
jgi:hypothetical protein